jgi:hypothetical protein
MIYKLYHMKRELDNYMSGTTAKYFQNNDILGYYLKLCNINNVDDLINYMVDKQNDKIHNTNAKESYEKNNIMDHILLRGIKYENYIMDEIFKIAKKKKYTVAIIVENKPEYKHYQKYLKETNNAIKNKVDIIYQGLIQCSDKNYKLRGFPDLIVSKRFFNKHFLNFIDKNNDCLATTINENTDYVIVDIKSSSVMMNVDGITARNTELLRTYKSQLSLYGKIMATKHKIKCSTYILPYTLKLDYTLNGNKYENIFINNVENIIKNQNKFYLVKVDIYNKDINYFDQIKENYKKFIECNNKFESQKKINFLLSEQMDELKKYNDNEIVDFKLGKKYLKFTVDSIKKININDYNIPIVKGYNIDKHEIKKWIALQNRSLSLVRGFNTNDLLELKNNGIISYLQTEEILDWYKKKQNKTNNYDIIKSILLANKNDNINKIYCDDCKYKLNEINTTILSNKFICCLDFETIPTKLIGLNDEFVFCENCHIKQKIFMIGLSIYYNDDNKLKKYGEYQIYLDKIIMKNNEIDIGQLDNDVICMFNKLKNYIYSAFNMFTDGLNSKENIIFLVWSSFEQNIMKQIKNFYDYSDDNKKLFDIKIVDLLKIFTDDYPIGINGAFDYSIKSIAYGYNINGLLNDEDYWIKSDVNNGFNAMYYAILHYIGNSRNNDKFEQIKKYNLVDCRIMSNIVNITYDLLIKYN